MEHVERVPPVTLVDKMIPVRDDIVHRATVVTIWNSTVHAAAGLRFQRDIIRLDDKLTVIAQPLCRIEIVAIAAVEFQEACFLAHVLAFPDFILLQPKRLLRARLRVDAMRVHSRAA